jgi:hypothetical protein
MKEMKANCEDDYGDKDRKYMIAKSYLEYIHNESSYYSTSERLNYLA